MIDEAGFTLDEKKVLRFLLQGKSDSQIALELGIARRTVEFHLTEYMGR